MGLFDFIKKKNNQSSNDTIQEAKTFKTNAQEEPKKKEEPKVQVRVEYTVKQDGPPSLSSLLKTAVPSKQGLYPHEILMLEYAPHFKTTNNNFQQFWYYQYSVTKPQSVLDSLYERGFIDVGDLKSALEKLKLPEIKEELKSLNLKVTGKKVELIDRLMENGDLNSLDKKYSERYFVITQKGEQELKENQYVSYLHRNHHMTIWEMNQRIAKTHLPYRDILWGYFNEQTCTHFKNFDFGLYRNTRLNMYQFLMEERKPKAAFRMLCEVLSYDLSGLGNSEKSMFEWEQAEPKLFVEIYESRIKYFFPYEDSSLTIPPAVSAWFEEMQDILGLNEKEYRDAILEALRKVYPPRRIFTDEECVDIIMANIHNDTTTLSDVYERAEKREKAKLKMIKSRIK